VPDDLRPPGTPVAAQQGAENAAHAPPPPVAKAMMVDRRLPPLAAGDGSSPVTCEEDETRASSLSLQWFFLELLRN
jgi:hypothetical protein